MAIHGIFKHKSLNHRGNRKKKEVFPWPRLKHIKDFLCLNIANYYRNKPGRDGKFPFLMNDLDFFNAVCN